MNFIFEKSIESLLQYFNRPSLTMHREKNGWHNFRYGEQTKVAIYVERFVSTPTITNFDIEYLQRLFSVIYLVETLESTSDSTLRGIDIYVSTTPSELPREFYSKVPTLVLEPTELYFSTVHNGEAEIKVLLKYNTPNIVSNIWIQEDIIEDIFLVLKRIMSLKHKYYPIERGSELFFRKVFLPGTILFVPRSVTIDDKSNVALILRASIPPETSSKDIIESLVEKIGDKGKIKEVKILKQPVRVLPQQEIHKIAEETFVKIYKRFPEYEWFPFSTVFNDLARVNDSILSIGPKSYSDITSSNVEFDVDVSKEFSNFISNIVQRIIQMEE
ncbi:hypothetical protein DRN38_01845 [Thermococci archaeon]|nr:MAG: hypothetical protein DRN38_01845 [Thermococci archaeon]